jgi:hypothetical protein
MVETVYIMVQLFLILGQLHMKGKVGRPYYVSLQDYPDSNLNILRCKNIKFNMFVISLNVYFGGASP